MITEDSNDIVILYVEQSPSWQANGLSATQEIL